MQKQSILRSVLAVVLIMFVAITGLASSPSAIALPVSPILAASSGGIFAFSGKRPTNLGIENGQFASCPSTPNCVSSQSSDPTHYIEPLTYHSSPEAALGHLQAVIQELPRTRIITATDDYLYAEFTSAIMGFVDDVEFSLDRATNTIQVRSASRLGESDLGVNRQRIETIRTQLTALDAIAAS